jgi:hypothetical protein
MVNETDAIFFAAAAAVSGVATRVMFTHTMVFETKTAVGDDDQFIENTKLPATVDKNHGLYRIADDLRRREDGLRHHDN